MLLLINSESMDGLLEEVLDSLVGDHLLLKDISARLRALHHLDNL